MTIREKKSLEVIFDHEGDIIGELKALLQRFEALREEGWIFESDTTAEISQDEGTTIVKNVRYRLVFDPKPVSAPTAEIVMSPELCKKLGRLIASLNLSPRTDNSLHNADIRTISNLVEKTEAYMLGNVRGFGERSLHEVKDALSEMGLKFGMKLPPK